jgi:L-lactate dehydrogenase
VGTGVVRIGRLEDLADARVLLLAWDPVVDDADVDLIGEARCPGAGHAHTLSAHPVVGRAVHSGLPGLIRDLDAAVPEGVLVMVTEPVDLLTMRVQDLSRRASARVLGTGTLPNSLHVQQLLGRYYRVDPRSVYVHVLGAHVLAEVPLWSQALVGGHPIVRGKVLGRTFDAEEMGAMVAASQVHVYRAMQGREDSFAAAECRGEVGGPVHAVVRAVADIVESILYDQRRVLTVSMRLTGTLGLSGMCLSLPGVVGADGLDGHILPHLADPEEQALREAGDLVANAGQRVMVGQ